MFPLLLSKRKAAALLGIGRDKLAKLIAAGHIRMVDVLEHDPKISREECERFAREGTGTAPTVSAVPLPKRRAASALRELRKEFGVTRSVRPEVDLSS